MSNSGQRISGSKPATHWLTGKIDLVIMVAALAALVIWVMLTPATPPKTVSEATVAGMQQNEASAQLYPTQRENGLPAHHHGR